MDEISTLEQEKELVLSKSKNKVFKEAVKEWRQISSELKIINIKNGELLVVSKKCIDLIENTKPMKINSVTNSKKNYNLSYYEKLRENGNCHRQNNINENFTSQVINCPYRINDRCIETNSICSNKKDCEYLNSFHTNRIRREYERQEQEEKEKIKVIIEKLNTRLVECGKDNFYFLCSDNGEFILSSKTGKQKIIEKYIINYLCTEYKENVYSKLIELCKNLGKSKNNKKSYEEKSERELKCELAFNLCKRIDSQLRKSYLKGGLQSAKENGFNIYVGNDILIPLTTLFNMSNKDNKYYATLNKQFDTTQVFEDYNKSGKYFLILDTKIRNSSYRFSPIIILARMDSYLILQGEFKKYLLTISDLKRIYLIDEIENQKFHHLEMSIKYATKQIQKDGDIIWFDHFCPMFIRTRISTFLPINNILYYIVGVKATVL